ncbi:response regulator transcription factor [Mariprofundus ferrooxydans]|nr:response regulator transcription factor [Mariprofundus ferrooxydans]
MQAFRKQSIVIIEDDRQTRLHLESVVKAHASLNLLGSAANCAEACVLLQKKPDIALVDLELPDGNGADLIRQFFAPDAKATDFVVMTVFGDDQHVIPALEAGACGYLLKDTPDDEIGNMISMLLDGGSPISPIIARKLLKRFHDPVESENPNPLTSREQEVLSLMSKGFNYKETAAMLSISYHTVIGYVKNIYRKLAVNSRSEAVFEASKMGLLQMNKV